jgi:hypothetical protein
MAITVHLAELECPALETRKDGLVEVPMQVYAACQQQARHSPQRALQAQKSVVILNTYEYIVKECCGPQGSDSFWHF